MTKDQERIERLKQTVSILPQEPGVYQYFNAEGTIIYVGKAKNLHRRVSSYFNKNHDSTKIKLLVSHIQQIKYIVVPTEEEALLLENSLIKQYQPRYNALLKDDKTYPSICITKEAYPKLFMTRNLFHNGSKYFGPYSNSYVAKIMVETIHQLYPLRNCKLDLSPHKIKEGKYRPCLQFHVKKCKAPCIALQSEEEYEVYIDNCRRILKGDIDDVLQSIKSEMLSLANQLKFEEAQEKKKEYELVQNYRAKSVIVNPTLHNIDVFSYDDNESHAFINYLNIVKGSIVRGITIEYKKNLLETKEELLSMAIIELRNRFQSISNEIFIPFMPDTELSGIKYHIPQKGDKKRLLELSEQNVRQHKIDKLKQAEKLNPEQRAIRILTKVQTDLGLKHLPLHIECFDNSNTAGTHPVASCVVFKMGKPAKKEYRHFHIKTVIGADDFASMREVMTRRYSRLLDEQQPLPDLVVVDGGKGQLNIAVEVMHQLGLTERIQIMGIAKRLEELFFPDDPIPIYLDKNGETLRLIQNLRDESHRFAITFHRKIRTQKQVKSELDDIKGIGEKSKTALLKEHKSITRIKQLTIEELEQSIGKAKAKIVFEQLINNKK